MGAKSLVFIGILVGSTVGGLVPSLFGAGIFSFWGILGSGLGAILGIYLASKFID